MLNRGDRVTFQETTFIGMLLKFGIINLTLKSLGFYLALLIAFFSHQILQDMQISKVVEITEFFSDSLSTISATLLGIIIAGLAIIVALSNGKVYHLLLQNKTLQDLLFPFWYVAFMWGIFTFITVTIKLPLELIEGNILKNIILFLIFLFTYTLYGTISLIGNTIRIMIYLAQLVDKD